MASALACVQEYHRMPDCSSRIVGSLNAHSTICGGITWLSALSNVSIYSSRRWENLGWPETQTPLENVGTGPSMTLDAETRHLIEDHNALDIELYELVKTGALHTASETDR
jgi:hypothetical protein